MVSRKGHNRLSGCSEKIRNGVYIFTTFKSNYFGVTQKTDYSTWNEGIQCIACYLDSESNAPASEVRRVHYPFRVLQPIQGLAMHTKRSPGQLITVYNTLYV